MITTVRRVIHQLETVLKLLYVAPHEPNGPLELGPSNEETLSWAKILARSWLRHAANGERFRTVRSRHAATARTTYTRHIVLELYWQQCKRGHTCSPVKTENSKNFVVHKIQLPVEADVLLPSTVQFILLECIVYTGVFYFSNDA